MADARAAGRLWDIGTGHDLMITEPQKVTGALLAVAAAESSLSCQTPRDSTATPTGGHFKPA